MAPTWFARELPPPLVYPMLAGFCLVCFGAIAFEVVQRKPITQFDSEQAGRMYRLAQSQPLVYKTALTITDLGSGPPRTIVVAAFAFVLILKKQWRLALFWALTQWFVKDLVAFAKNWFERPRPNFPETGWLAMGWAFPSGHAAGAMATYGMLALLAGREWRGRWYCWPFVALCCAIILAVGLSRLLLGVHWFTDVLGGYLLALAYISLCTAAIEWAIRSQRRP